MTPDLQPHGHHLLLDMYACASDAVCADKALHTLIKAAAAAGVTVLNSGSHDFGKHAGVTVFALLAESHIALHSWPEHHYIAADIFTCGNGDVDAAARILVQAYAPARCERRLIIRGDCSL